MLTGLDEASEVVICTAMTVLVLEEDEEVEDVDEEVEEGGVDEVLELLADDVGADV